MRLLLSFVALAVGMGRTAAADPTYPEASVDRPQLMYGGMTSLDLGLDFPTYVQTSVDANGNATTTKTTLGDDHDADIVLTHSYGSFELSGRIVGNRTGPFLQAGFRTYLGAMPGVLSISAEIKAPQSNSAFEHEYSENVGYGYKATVAPDQLALYANASVTLTEIAVKPGVMSPSGAYVFGSAGFGVQGQITQQFAIAGGIGASVPIHRPDAAGASSMSFETSTSLIYVLGRWDIYGQVGLGDLTSSRMPFAYIGAVHRWGG